MTLKSSSSQLQCFQLIYKSFEGYTNLLGRKVEKYTPVTNAEYRFRGCIFNVSLKRFEGCFTEGSPCKLVEVLHAGAVVCPVDQVFFFYCSHPDPNLVLVTELIASFESEDGEQRIGLGWSLLPLFDAGRAGKGPSTRLAVNEGSPRTLFTLTHPTAENKELVPIPGCILSCSLTVHPSLVKASHLFPPNTLLTLDSQVPGLMPTRTLEAFPKLLKTLSGNFEKVSLLLLPSVDDFEDDLLSSITRDLSQEGCEVISTAGSVSIEERKLKVLLYNGWCFTGPPSIGYLVRPTPSKISGSFRGSNFGLRGNLVLKGSLEVTDLLSHPETELVFQLEYVISWPRTPVLQNPSTKGTPAKKAAGKQRDKPSTTHSTALTLAWGVWRPFSSDSESSQSVELRRGLGFQPTLIPSSAHSSCYESGLTDAGKISFKFTSSKLSRTESSQFLNTNSTVQFEGRRSFSRHSVNFSGRDMPDSGPGYLSPSLKTPIRSPSLRLAQTELELNTDSLHTVDVVPSSEISLQQSRAAAIPHSVLAYFDSIGVEDFKNYRGDSLTVIAPSVVLTETNKDLLTDGPMQLAVQLMGISLHDSQQSGVSLTLNCSHFPAVDFHCICTSSTASDMPCTLSMEGTSQPGVTHFWSVDHLTLPSKTDRIEFKNLLLHGQLVIDVYDRSSLFLIGSAKIPLRTLYRSGDLVFCQCNLSVPVLLSSGIMDRSLFSALTPSKISETGTLYVRLARLPGAVRSSPVMRDQGCKRVCVARRLYSTSPTDQWASEDEQTRQRKRNRMYKVREMNAKLAGELQPSLSVPDPQANILDIQREELKQERIAVVLQEALTTTHHLRPRPGRVQYFEHPFTNTTSQSLTVNLVCQDPHLKVVVNQQEAFTLRHHYAFNTAFNEGLVSQDPHTGQGSVFVHSGETVYIPFKYQSLSHHHDKADQSKCIKAFLQLRSGEVVGIASVSVDPLPPAVDQVFHCYHTERAFVKKKFTISGEHKQMFACASNPDILCEVTQQVDSGKWSLLIKVPVKASPSSESVYIMIYYDQEYLVTPDVVWKLYVHAAHRVDHSMVMGQSSTVKLMMRGSHTDRRVACYSFSTPNTLKVLTTSPLLLSGDSLAEFPVSMLSMVSGESVMLVSCVDVDTRRLVQRWLIHSHTAPPSVSKTFQMRLPSKGSEPMKKTISFKNPYSKKKSFCLLTDRPDIVEFASTKIKLLANETTVLDLNFLPHHNPGTEEVLVFINENKDQTEDCFLVKVVYS